jgi:DNA-binding transcriptional ArsR family regulator
VVDIRASAPGEFLLHLHACSSPGEHGAATLGKAWFAATRAAAAPDLLAAIEQFSDPGPGATTRLWPRLLGLACETPASHDVPAFLAHLGALPPLQLRLTLLGYHAEPQERVAPPEVLFLAAQGDEASLREVAAKQFPRDRARRDALLALLAAGPEGTRARLLALLRRWYEEVFRGQEAEILPILERDARATRVLSHTLSLEELVETVTNGVEFHSWPGLRRVALLPTYVMRPWTEWHLYRETELLFCYPVSDDSLVEAGDGPPARLVRLHQALGDERRLRILRHLATEKTTFQELANALDLPKSSLHYHLGILRSAGLLRASAGPKGIRYSLRREGLPGMGEALLRYFEAGAT